MPLANLACYNKLEKVASGQKTYKARVQINAEGGDDQHEKSHTLLLLLWLITIGCLAGSGGTVFGLWR